MTREQAKVIVDELSTKKKLNTAEKDQLLKALKVLANKWSLPE